MKSSSPAAKQALVDGVKNQIKENNPPIVKQAYLRLLSEGISEEDVFIHLARALAGELFDMMREKKSFNVERYGNRLARLPND